MFIRLIKKWYALLLSVFWARKCAGCGQISEDGLFCSVCREVLLQPLWLSGREALDGVGMLFRYNGALKTALQNVKFKNRRDILELLAEECCRISVDGWPEFLRNILSKRDVMIVPIPTSRQRTRARGFEIPLVLFKNTDAEYCLTPALTRRRETVPQYDLSPQERKMNLEDLKKRQEKIRNFSIIAHIDHGKSTLADRILEATETVSSREMQAQLLDSMDLERERGITIKLNAIELNYTAKDGETYIFHLIDTPGHVDFTYEVSRSLAACEGAILVVDAAQGIEAQTLANVYLALDNDLEILPVINKIDLPAADPERVRTEVEDVIGLDASEAVLASAKAGIGIEEILEQIVEKVPAPTVMLKPSSSLDFDSVYDAYRGVILQVRVVNGMVKPGDKIQLMSNGKTFDVTEVGIFTPKAVGRDFLATGDVGYIAASIKTVADTRVGDTVTLATNPASEPLHGYKQMNPMVFCWSLSNRI